MIIIKYPSIGGNPVFLLRTIIDQLPWWSWWWRWPWGWSWWSRWPWWLSSRWSKYWRGIWSFWSQPLLTRVWIIMMTMMMILMTTHDNQDDADEFDKNDHHHFDQNIVWSSYWRPLMASHENHCFYDDHHYYDHDFYDDHHDSTFILLGIFSTWFNLIPRISLSELFLLNLI